MLLFFRIGFLCCKKEFVLEIRLLPIGEAEGIRNDLSAPVCRGPYNHVTSQSLSLDDVSHAYIISSQYATNQFRVSGEIVFNLFFDFAHVRHEAFSNLALLL